MNLVYEMDRKYSGQNAVACANEGEQTKIGNIVTNVHGKLTVHGSGAYLICGVCGYAEPTSGVK